MMDSLIDTIHNEAQLLEPQDKRAVLLGLMEIIIEELKQL